MKKTLTLLVSIPLFVLLLVGGANAQNKSSEPNALTCDTNAEQYPAQINNPHWSPNEPWKKRWAIGASDFMQGKFAEAEPELVEALKLAKEVGYTDVQPTVLQMLGLVYMQEGKSEQAVSTLQQAIDMEKAAPQPFKGTIYAALIGLGDTYRREKIYDKALSSLLEAKAMMTPCSPGYWQLTENTAQVYYGMGKLSEAEATYNDLISYAEQTHSDNLMYRALTGLEDVQLQRKDYSKLADTMDRAYPYVVKKFGAESQEATIFAKNIQHVKDARNAQHAPVSYGGAAKEWIQLITSGNNNMNTKRYALAVSDFQKALKLAEAEGTQTLPTALTRAKLGLSYSHTGNFKGAEAMFAQALPILKQHPEVTPANTLAGYEKLYQLAKSKNKDSQKR
jgi:tetratricopeptide (TPR) repeat protein